MATYKVKKGETFSQIADKLGITEEELRQMNKGVQTLSQGQGIRYPQRTKKQAGYYQTGENERLTVKINGQTVRIPPNSSVSPNQPTGNIYQQLWNSFAQKTATASQTAAAGGSLADVPLTLTQKQAQQLGTLNAGGQGGSTTTYKTGEGETQTVTGPNGEQIRLGPNSTYTPTSTPQLGIMDRVQQYFQNLSGNWGNNPTSQPASIRGSTGKGINGLAAPTPLQGPGPEVLAQQGSLLGTKGWTGRPNQMAPWMGGAASYAPQGNYSYQSYQPIVPNSQNTPNRLQPYQPPQQGAPFMTQNQYLQGLSNPMQNGGAPFMTSYQILNGMTNFKPPQMDMTNGGQFSKDSFENIKQRTIKNGGTRWWIGRGGNGRGDQQQFMQPVPFNPMQTQQLNWRVNG